jgi:uncharacterized protein
LAHRQSAVVHKGAALHHLRFGLPRKPAPVLGKSSFQSADREAAFLEAVRLAGFGNAEAHPLFGRPVIHEYG